MLKIAEERPRVGEMEMGISSPRFLCSMEVTF